MRSFGIILALAASQLVLANGDKGDCQCLQDVFDTGACLQCWFIDGQCRCPDTLLSGCNDGIVACKGGTNDDDCTSDELKTRCIGMSDTDDNGSGGSSNDGDDDNGGKGRGQGQDDNDGNEDDDDSSSSGATASASASGSDDSSSSATAGVTLPTDDSSSGSNTTPAVGLTPSPTSLSGVTNAPSSQTRTSSSLALVLGVVASFLLFHSA